MTILFLFQDVSCLNGKDPKADWKGVSISGAWSRLKDCSFRCLCLGWEDLRSGLPTHDLSIYLGFLTAWQPQVARFPTGLHAQCSSEQVEVHWLSGVPSVTSAAFRWLHLSVGKWQGSKRLGDSCSHPWRIHSATTSKRVCEQWHSLKLPEHGTHTEQTDIREAFYCILPSPAPGADSCCHPTLSVPVPCADLGRPL